MSTGLALQFLYPAGDPLVDWVVKDDGGGPVITYWNTAGLGTQPTSQAIAAALADNTTVGGQVYSEWLAEHGGDAALTLRRIASEAVDTSDPAYVFTRALALVVLDELNVHAARITAILDAIDGASSLADVKTAIAAINDIPQRTIAQLKTAMKAQIAAGSADNGS